MSQHETWRTKQFWESTGGLLIEEFLAVRRSEHQGQRLIDAIIVLNEETAIHKGNTYDLSGKDVICIQTKASRLGMGLLGQSYFSQFLIQQHQPKSIRSVAICSKTDAVLEALAKEHGVVVVVIGDREL